MKDGLIHVCFVLDESGSMYSSTSDVKGGFNSVIEEQKAQAKGGCIISLFKFNDKVNQVYLGKDVNDIDGNNLEYQTGGCTAMNDGIGTAIDSVGKWLADMDESERPEKNLVVIMTDGYENASHEYSLSEVRERIKHQTEKYDWSFVYMGTDITDSTYSKDLTHGLKNCTSMFSDRSNVGNSYEIVNSVASTWRNMSGSTYSVKSSQLSVDLTNIADNVTTEYERKTGNKIT
jgi:uncharacterized protein YegL